MFRALSIAAGILSLSVLAWKGFKIDFGPLLLGMLQSYEYEAQRFFNLFEPIVLTHVEAVSQMLNLELQLHPHWKHVFVLLWLLFGATAQSQWKMGNAMTALFMWSWGLIVALSAGVLSGLSSPDSSEFQLLVVLSTVLAHLIFLTGSNAWTVTFSRDALLRLYSFDEGEAHELSWGRAFKDNIYAILLYFGIPGAAACILASQSPHIPYLRDIANPGLVIVFFLTLSLMVMYLIDPILRPVEKQSEEESWFETYRNNSGSMIGLSMLSVVAGASFFVLLGTLGV